MANSQSPFPLTISMISHISISFVLKSHALSFCGKLIFWRTSNSALRDKIYDIIIIGTGGFPIREQLRKDSGTAIESLGLIQASPYTAAVTQKDIKTIDLLYAEHGGICTPYLYNGGILK